MENDDHPVVSLFRGHAEKLDAAHAPRDPDDAIVKLARWMSINIKRLDAMDIEMLSEVGGIMYREQLRRWMLKRVK